jgi:hypothetical protein
MVCADRLVREKMAAKAITGFRDLSSISFLVKLTVFLAVL